MNSVDLLMYFLSSEASECEMLCLTQGQWAAMALFLGLCIFKFAELALVLQQHSFCCMTMTFVENVENKRFCFCKQKILFWLQVLQDIDVIFLWTESNKNKAKLLFHSEEQRAALQWQGTSLAAINASVCHLQNITLHQDFWAMSFMPILCK